MCGIAGILDPSKPPERALLARMAQTMARRGPDDEGILSRGAIGLAHRRLAIIDLAGGHQPIFNEDETLAIVANGEIYDFRELRRELQRRGHVFRTASDTEVVLHMYEESGPDCLARLNGMFALAIADFARGELFLARDRFGQKPLFYAAQDGAFAFASGPAALAEIPWVDAFPDPIAIHDFLELQYIPQPRTIHCGIRKLPPGHWLRWPGKADAPVPYWRPKLVPEFAGRFEDAAAEARELLARAVGRRLVAEVPLGAFLSGGMDSGIVCALASGALREAGAGPLKTYSIGFPVAKYDERDYARAVAEYLGADHHFLEVNPGDFTKMAEVVGAFEEPFADASMLPTYLLSGFTREHVTVALSGDGADELFGGYYRYRVMRLGQLMTAVPVSLRALVQRPLLAILPAKIEERTLWGRLRRLVELLDVDGLARYLKLISRFPAELRRQLYTDDMRVATGNSDARLFFGAHWPDSGSLVDRVMELDCRTYLPEDILVKVDRASMAHGLEVRSPFLDPEVARFAFSLPERFKQTLGARKRILQQAFRHDLPPAILSRPKMGFGVPVSRWLREQWRAPAAELLHSAALRPYFRIDRLENLLADHCANRADHGYAIFALVVLALWLEAR